MNSIGQVNSSQLVCEMCPAKRRFAENNLGVTAPFFDLLTSDPEGSDGAAINDLRSLAKGVGASCLSYIEKNRCTSYEIWESPANPGNDGVVVRITEGDQGEVVTNKSRTPDKLSARQSDARGGGSRDFGAGTGARNNFFTDPEDPRELDVDDISTRAHNIAAVTGWVDQIDRNDPNAPELLFDRFEPYRNPGEIVDQE